MSPTLWFRLGRGLRFTSTSTLRALVTLSPDPSLAKFSLCSRDASLSRDKGGNFTPADDRRTGFSCWLVSNDVTDVIESRGWRLVACATLESVRFCVMAYSGGGSSWNGLSSEPEALLTVTVMPDCGLPSFREALRADSCSLRVRRSLYSRRNAFVARLPD